MEDWDIRELLVMKYNTWSSYKPEDEGIFIAYASIYGNTANVAKKLAEMLKEKGAKKVILKDLARDDLADAIESAFRYDKIILAASSYNMGVFPPMEHFLNQLKGKNYQNRKIGIIENGTWAPSAGKCMKDIISNMKDITIYEPTVTVMSTLNEETSKKLEELAYKVLENC